MSQEKTQSHLDQTIHGQHVQEEALLTPADLSHQKRIQSPTTIDLTTEEEPPQKKKQKSSFRLQAKRLFLTYPQCAISKELAQENLNIHFPNLTWYIIAEEQHKDGTPHLHIALESEDKLHLSGVKGTKILDALVACSSHPNGKHGNYQAMKSVKGSVEYLIKDNSYLVHGINPEEVLRKQSSKNPEFKTVVQKMLEGCTPTQILQEHPTCYAARRKNILDFHFDLTQLKKSTMPTTRLCRTLPKDLMVDTTYGLRLTTWLNKNLSSQADPRVFKQEQLWLYGPSNVGKTSILNELGKHLRIYHIPAKDYYCEWTDENYDLAALDEYTGSKTLGFLNSWLEGSPLPLDQKNKPNYVKKFNIPTIICSNLSPDQIYAKCKDVQLTALKNRLEIIYAEGPITIEYVWEEINK